MAQMVATSRGAMVDPKGYKSMANAMGVANAEFRNAALSTRNFEVHQLRLNSATDEYIKKLQKQKLSFRDIRREWDLGKRAYREQLAMQSMVVRKGMTTIGGRQTIDVIVPNEAHKSLDTLGNQIGFIREQTRSAATQMINWGKNTQWAGRQLMVGFTMPVVAFGAATGVLAYQIDKQFTRIQKVYDTTADATSKRLEDMKAVEKELAQVRVDSYNTAIKSASQYGAAAHDTLDVQANLAATGLTGRQLQESTNEVMRIATLGEMEYQDALNATISLQSVFGQSTKELTESFNYMNSVENATSLQLKDFTAAIPIAAAPIKMMGGDIKTLGVLLTAMKERGIEATQGANAIKAAMQRLYRPSKQIQEEFKAITNASILDIRDRNQGDIVGMLTDIGELTKDLSKSQRIQAFAGLFGTYQVTRISALVSGLQDLKAGVGQVSDAYRLGQQAPADWADAADREMKRFQESASGRFKTTLETLKLEMADMGEPFIEIGTTVLKVFMKIAKAFNSLPDGVKHFAALAMIFGALIGPAIMLIGLFANLVGNILKFGVSITGFLGRMEILDRDSRAANLAAKLASAGFAEWGTQTQKLTQELQQLAAAQTAANRAARQSRIDFMLANGMARTRSEAYGRLAAERRQELAVAGRMGPNGQVLPAQGPPPDTGDSEKIKRNWKAIGGNIALAASTLAIFGMNQEGVVGKTAKIVFYAALLGPALAAGGQAVVWMLPHLRTAGTILKTNAAFAWMIAKAQLSTASGWKSLGASMISWINPYTAAAAVALGVGYGVYKIFDKISDQAKEQKAQQEALANSASLWADTLGRVEKGYAKIRAPYSGESENKFGGPSLAEQANKFAASPGGSKIVTAYNEASPGGQETIAMQQYIKVLQETDGTAADARRALEVMFIAAGDGALGAQVKAQKFYETLGEIDRADLGQLWGRKLTEAAFDSQGAAEAAGTEMGKNLADSIAKASTGTGKENILSGFQDSITGAWDLALDTDISKPFLDNLKAFGVTGADEIQGIMADWQEVLSGNMTETDFTKSWGIDQASQRWNELRMELTTDTSLPTIERLKDAEAKVAGELARQLLIGREINTLAELRTTWEWKLYTVTKKNAAALWESKKAQLDAERVGWSLMGQGEKINEDTYLTALNQVRVANGMRKTGRLADGMGRATVDINGNVIMWGRNQDGVNDKLREGLNLTERQRAILKSITNEDMGNMVKDAMGTYQQAIADATEADFDSRMDSAMEAAEKAGQKRVDAAQRATENIMDNFDKRWDKRLDNVGAFYDKRIEGIKKEVEAEKKADDIRQKLFEAEKARIERLNEMANRNVDFNAALNAGNFDEAAKIRNDSEAAAVGWALDDASEKANKKSEKRIDRLEGQVDRLEKIKDKRLDHLKEIEDAERKALQRSRDRREAAIKADVDATVAAEKKKWDTQKKHLDEALKYFLGYTATSDKDLRNHMKIWEERYGKFNLTTKGMFDATSKHVAEYLRKNLEDSQREFANQRDWQLSGAQIATSMLKGAFGMTRSQFKEFMTTGVWPDGADPMSLKDIKAAGTAGGFRPGLQSDAKLHTGGIVGKDKGGSAGIRSGHPDEVKATLLKGEGVLNRHAMSNLGEDGFRAINNGLPFGGAGGEVFKGASMGFSGLMGALMARSMMSAVSTGIQSGIVNKVTSIAAAGKNAGSYAAGKAGTYGDVAFDATQLRNAGIIASMGKQMGMSARDIEIGIMTSITESMLRNVDYGDRDSLGLFQQRPSMGWGTAEQVTNPEYAAKKFFTELKKVGNRSNLSPWMAAQTVQRSAYSDGSNYRQYWDEAKAIFGGLTANSGGVGAGYVAGKGGWHKPAPGGYHWSNSHDYGVPRGTPLYAVSDGTITDSRAITSGGSAGNGKYATPYRSYGETIAMRTASGDIFRYAHLSPGARYVKAGQQVKGGALIGRSGETGNAWGAHVHMDVNGNYDALGWLRSHGIGLKTGGYTMTDGLANLHKEEVVIDPARTRKIMNGIDGQFANGQGNTYNVEVNVPSTNATPEEIAKVVITTIKRQESRKPQSRRG